MRLPGDAEWRELSGYGEPAAYAPAVAQQVTGQIRSHVRAHQGVEVPSRHLPPRTEQWSLLLEHLGREGTVREVGPGRLEVSLSWDGEASTVTVVVTPDEWEQALHRYGTGAGLGDFFGPLLASRDPDETFVVFWRSDLRRSVREKLPPVRGTAEERAMKQRIEAALAENPDATFGWYAYPPGDARGRAQGRE